MTPKQFRTYFWLVQTISDNDGITFEEINKLWIKNKTLSEGNPMVKRTFIRYRNEIEMLFGVDIRIPPHSKYKYYIKNMDLIDNNSIHNWMMTTLVVRNHLEEDIKLHDRILLEDIPSGSVWLDVIIEAMKENYKLKVLYRKFDDTDTKEWMLSPYCLKMYSRRWYLLAKTEKDALLTFALDRMKDVELTGERFVMDERFNGGDYFKDMYGVYKERDSRRQRLVIRTFDDEHHYLRALPLHHSQKEIGSGENYVDFEMKMHLNKELSGFILSRGKRMQVLKPKAFAEKLESMRTGS